MSEVGRKWMLENVVTSNASVVLEREFLEDFISSIPSDITYEEK